MAKLFAEGKAAVPFALLTNASGKLEKERAKQFNHTLFGTEESFLKAEHIICAHTPLKELVPKYKDRPILIGGRGDILEISKHYGFNKAITGVELYSLMPHLCPLLNVFTDYELYKTKM